MPVSQFPWPKLGLRRSLSFRGPKYYGGPEGLKRLVNACHGQGLAVVLMSSIPPGPEGNYLAISALFTDRYHPWGQAIISTVHKAICRFAFLSRTAICWLDEFHIDPSADAVHGIIDRNAQPFCVIERRG